MTVRLARPRNRAAAILAVAVATLLIAAARPAHAQSRLRFDAGGGAAIALAPDAIPDLWQTGFTLSAAVRARVTPRFLVGPEFSYSRFRFDADAFESSLEDIAPAVNVSGNSLYFVSVLADAEYALLNWGNTRPFVRGGIGWGRARTVDGSASGPNASAVEFPQRQGDGLSARIGGGVRTLLTPTLTLLVDAGWHIVWIDPDPVQFVPIRIGLRF